VTWAEVAASSVLWEERFVRPPQPITSKQAPPSGRDAGRPVVGLRIAAPEIFCREYLAALAAGVCVVPVDSRCTPAEFDRYAASFRLTHLLSDGAEVLDLRAARHLRSKMLTAPRDSAGERPSFGEPDSIVSIVGLADSLDLLGEPAAVLSRTAGSSGAPKLVPLTERQLVAVAARAVEHLGLSASDRGFAAVPLFHVDSQVVGILAALISGGSLAVEDTFEPESFWHRVEATGATWLNLSPATIARLTAVPGPSEKVRQQVRFARSGLEALPLATHSRFWMLTGISVLESYTMTEAAGQVAANPLLAAGRLPGSVGMPVGTKVRIVGASDAVGPGQPGHVEVHGVGVITSYLPEGRLGPLIEACDADGWLRTGDVGWVDDAGYLFLAGQLADVIEQAEARLYPREIEDVLVSVLGVVEAAVVGRPVATGGELPVAFIATGRDPEAGADEALRQRVADACAAKLVRSKRPFEIVVAESLPLAPTGKVARQQLRKVLNCRLTGAA
jgi:acyl-CoA synthetase (AMP-forming)/AMP-acid ligase II